MQDIFEVNSHIYSIWVKEKLPHLLKQVVVNMTPNGVPFEVKIDVHVFAKATRVVIAIGLCITKCLQDNIG